MDDAIPPPKFDLLVLGTDVDPHIHAVLQHLPDTVTVMRFDIDRYPVSFESSLRISNSAASIDFLRDTAFRIVDNLPVVWFRRIGLPGLDPSISDRAHRKFAFAEAESYITGLAALLAEAKWINQFELTKRAASKPYQLQEAIRAGLSVPATLITNSPLLATEFIADNPRSIYKTLSAPSVDIGDKRSLIFTHLLEEGDLTSIAQVKFAPCMFQEYVEKAYELRITYIGGVFFVVRIYSQDKDDTSIDWRAGDWDSHRYEISLLPADIQDRLGNLMSSLKLQFGAIDMIVTPAGQHVFLEVNPHGAWLWLEQATGIPISQGIARYIAEMCQQ